MGYNTCGAVCVGGMGGGGGGGKKRVCGGEREGKNMKELMRGREEFKQCGGEEELWRQGESV